MKVIQYVPSIDKSSGGVGVYLQTLSAELGKLVDLHVVTHHGLNPLALHSCHTHYISKDRHYGRMKKEFLELLQKIQPDVVHVNCCWRPGSAWVQKWSSQRGYKTVYSPHGMLEPWIIKRHYWTKKLPALLLYQKDAIKRADIIHATSESEMQNLLRLGYNSNIEVVPNGIDVKRIQLKQDWKLKRTLLFLSRVHEKKGVELLIGALAELKNELEDYRIVIAGEGETAYIRELQGLAHRKGVEEIVEFIGGVYDEGKWVLYRSADVFVLPTHSENFGIVVAEALASGTPVITTTETPWDEIKTYRCGWWVPCNQEDIKFAVHSAIHETEDNLEMLGRNGRRLMEKKYSIEAVTEQMVEMYRKCCSGRQEDYAIQV